MIFVLNITIEDFAANMNPCGLATVVVVGDYDVGTNIGCKWADVWAISGYHVGCLSSSYF